MLRLGAELRQLLGFLPQLLLQDADLAAQPLLARAVQGLLIGGQARRDLGDLLRQLQRAAFAFGTQALDPGQQGEAVGFAFAHVGHEAGVVQTQQRVALVHHLAFADENLRDDAAFQVLDGLHLARGNRLAFAGGHLVEHGEMGPHQRGQEKQGGQPDRQAGQAGGVLHQRALDFRHELGIAGLTQRVEVTTQALQSAHERLPRPMPGRYGPCARLR
ncbi:hypothetical protein D3C81_1385500 [compost metagenome]